MRYSMGLCPLTRTLTEKCPPCFNCMLPAFTCGQYGECDPYNGQCNCPPGWGGIDCLTPRKCPYLSCSEILAHVYAECDSLADGEERHLREEGKACQCKDGWGGINCNGSSVRSTSSAVLQLFSSLPNRLLLCQLSHPRQHNFIRCHGLGKHDLL
jgi:hypothetical protein